jgi:hypothetical protein
VEVAKEGEPMAREDFGLLIDELDNLSSALELPLRPEMHVQQLRVHLPELVRKFKAVYADEFKDNPWE